MIIIWMETAVILRKLKKTSPDKGNNKIGVQSHLNKIFSVSYHCYFFNLTIFYCIIFISES